VLATIATDFSEPGNRMYLGVSVRFLRKVLVTGGAASASVTEGRNPVTEQLAELTDTRQLYGSLATRRQWKPFLGISFTVF
jgi:hypothetical protein